jgi:hypothetical protein
VAVSMEPTSLNRGEGLRRRGRQSRFEGGRARAKVLRVVEEGERVSKNQP